jgi:hypothetical protein
VANYGPPDVASAARLHVALAGDSSADWRDELPRALESITVIPDDDLMTALATLGLVPEWMQGRVALGARPALLRALGREAPAEEHLVVTKRKPPGRSLAAADPQRPWAELMALADDEDAEVRATLAGNPALGPTDLLELKLREDCNDNDPRVYEALAANPQAPGELLRSIAMNRTALNTAARRKVARNLATPPDVLILLADELYAADIRIILASHPNLGPEQRAIMVTSSLEAALGSGSPIYRAIALSYAAVDPAIIALALRSPHWIERLAVALSPAADATTLAHLTEDGNRLVRAAAQER